MMVVASTVMMMMVVAAMMVVMIGPAQLVQGLVKLPVDLSHQGHGAFETAGNVLLAFMAHDATPLLELVHMPLVMLHPVLQHDPQLINIVHCFSQKNSQRFRPSQVLL